MKTNNLGVLLGLVAILLVALVLLLISLHSIFSHTDTEQTPVGPAPVTTAKTTSAPSLAQPTERPILPQTAAVKKDVVAAHPYLHSIADIRGRQGQYKSQQIFIECPDDLTVYKNFQKHCLEITFQDGSKSIIYMNKDRGLIARKDFDANGQPISLHEYASFGGFFDTEKNRRAPIYPTAPVAGIIYNAPKHPSQQPAQQTGSFSLRQEQIDRYTDTTRQEHTRGPQYCDFYPSECRAD